MKGNNNEKKKKTIIVVAMLAVCFVVAGIFAGLILPSDSDAKETKAEKNNEAVTSDSKTTEKKDTTVKTDKNNNKNNDKKDKNKDKTSSKDNAANKPAKHSHDWVAVYKEVDNGHYETITTKEAYTCCNACGADITGNTSAHLKAHALAGDENASRRTAYRYIETQEWVPNIEKVVNYYKCNCGATN